MKNVYAPLSACLLLLTCAAQAAHKKPYPPEAAAPLSLSERAPLPVDATVAGLPISVQGSDIIVVAGNNDASSSHVDLHKDALTPFVAVLNAYPQAHTVDLSWFEPYFLSADSADVLYDRVKHTVTIDYSSGGGDEPEHTGKVVFTGVRESVFAEILKVHPAGMSQGSDAVSVDWGGFGFLSQPRYGCRVLAPKARHKHHHVRHAAR